MIKHIVFFKLKNNSSQSAQEVKKRLLSLQKHIDVLKSIEVGIDFKKSERSYDIALITVFENEEDLNAYAIHPYHLEVVKFIKERAKDSKTVDFKY